MFPSIYLLVSLHSFAFQFRTATTVPVELLHTPTPGGERSRLWPRISTTIFRSLKLKHSGWPKMWPKWVHMISKVSYSTWQTSFPMQVSFERVVQLRWSISEPFVVHSTFYWKLHYPRHRALALSHYLQLGEIPISASYRPLLFLSRHRHAIDLHEVPVLKVAWQRMLS